MLVAFICVGSFSAMGQCGLSEGKERFASVEDEQKYLKALLANFGDASDFADKVALIECLFVQNDPFKFFDNNSLSLLNEVLFKDPKARKRIIKVIGEDEKFFDFLKYLIDSKIPPYNLPIILDKELSMDSYISLVNIKELTPKQLAALSVKYDFCFCLNTAYNWIKASAPKPTGPCEGKFTSSLSKNIAANNKGGSLDEVDLLMDQMDCSIEFETQSSGGSSSISWLFLALLSLAGVLMFLILSKRLASLERRVTELRSKRSDVASFDDSKLVSIQGQLNRMQVQLNASQADLEKLQRKVDSAFEIKSPIPPTQKNEGTAQSAVYYHQYMDDFFNNRDRNEGRRVFSFRNLANDEVEYSIEKENFPFTHIENRTFCFTPTYFEGVEYIDEKISSRGIASGLLQKAADGSWKVVRKAKIFPS